MECEKRLEQWLKSQSSGENGIGVLMSEKQSLENQVKALEDELRGSPIKVTKEDENKISELEEGYRAEIEKGC